MLRDINFKFFIKNLEIDKKWVDLNRYQEGLLSDHSNPKSLFYNLSWKILLSLCQSTSSSYKFVLISKTFIFIQNHPDQVLKYFAFELQQQNQLFHWLAIIFVLLSFLIFFYFFFSPIFRCIHLSICWWSNGRCWYAYKLPDDDEE